MNKKEYENLYTSIQNIFYFIDNRQHGESYWVDDEGLNHSVDLGYVYDFLHNLTKYCETKI